MWNLPFPTFREVIFFSYEEIFFFPEESDNHEGQEDILSLSAVWLCLKEWRAFHFALN